MHKKQEKYVILHLLIIHIINNINIIYAIFLTPNKNELRQLNLSSVLNRSEGFHTISIKINKESREEDKPTNNA